MQKKNQKIKRKTIQVERSCENESSGLKKKSIIFGKTTCERKRIVSRNHIIGGKHKTNISVKKTFINKNKCQHEKKPHENK